MTAFVALAVVAVLPWAAARRHVGGRRRVGVQWVGVGAAGGRAALGRAALGRAAPGRAVLGLSAPRGEDAVALRGGRPHTSGRTWPSPWPRPRPGGADDGDPALLLDLVAVALAAGAPVPLALATVGVAWPGAAGRGLVRAARAIELGAPWDVAWARGVPAVGAVAEALEPAWTAGASPVPLLRTAADRLRSRRRAETRAAAGRLGVQLVVPLTLCFLPAFVLVGLVPVLVSLASGLLG